jgi:hypothetical protein
MTCVGSADWQDPQASANQAGVGSILSNVVLLSDAAWVRDQVPQAAWPTDGFNPPSPGPAEVR